MVEPRIIARAEHSLSRKDVDPDALKVLYRLRQYDHVAYLVGGSVRDLLLARRPKDFDIGTSAHPYQVKKLFRNCWIIGRRFRLAHVKFGSKTVEVATFRRQVELGEEIVQDGVPAPDPTTPGGALLVHHDNTFGTPEEDAFRRDFTINALFYDISTFSIIDYVGGLDDLRAGVVRSIGDPLERFLEDPVRMLRAVAMAARLDFAIDPPVLEAIRDLRHEIARSSPPRMLEEYYKILRSGSAEKTFRILAKLGLLEPVSSELHHGSADPLWRSLAAVDAYRRRFDAIPDTMTNPILLGSLLAPLGLLPQPGSRSDRPPRQPQAAAEEAAPDRRERRREPGPRLGELPLARRDVERLSQIVVVQRRLRDLGAGERARRAIVHRSNFRDGLTWLDMHGGLPEVVEQWKALLAEAPSDASPAEAQGEGEQPPQRRRRRRRRRRGPRPATEP